LTTTPRNPSKKRKSATSAAAPNVANEVQQQATQVTPLDEEQRAAARWTLKAQIAQKRRREVPLTTLDGDEAIPQKEAIKRFAAPHGGQDAEDGFHFGFMDWDLMDSYADKGYEPQLDDEGRIFKMGKDPLMKIPTDLYAEEQERVRMRDARQMRDSAKADTEHGTVSSDKIEIHEAGSPEHALARAKAIAGVDD